MNLQLGDLTICQELKDRLNQAVPLVNLKLFGSRSRGDSRPDSDYDFLVEVERSDVAIRHTIRRLAWEVAFAHNTIVQTIIMTSAQLTHGPEKASLLVKEIEKDGVTI